MKLLLDTHIWLWSIGDPSRLSTRVARALVDSTNELWLSPISIWEVLLLRRKGRIALLPDLATWMAAAHARVPFKEAPLTQDVAMETENVVLAHRDPADRFLAATAKTYGLTLVTADENLLSGSGYQVLANR
jgi:PIN domain nuclease of toxin-antitoxin system